VDNIHLTEDARFRKKLEAAYIKALAHASAVEEQFHGSEIDPPESAEQFHDDRSRNALFDELLNKSCTVYLSAKTSSRHRTAAVVCPSPDHRGSKRVA